MDLTNPSNLPDPSEIEYMEEPMVKAEIMVTSEYIGTIMDLCQERRGIYQGMEYIEETRAVLHYHLPLNEIIYDFFDALKSRSRGYASFDYEMLGYQQSNLVKLDILINKETVDALSFIVFEGSAYASYLPSVSPAAYAYAKYHRHSTWQARPYASLLPSLWQ